MAGQIHFSPKLNSAYMDYVLNPPENDPKSLVPVIEGMIKQAGQQWLAKQIVAEIEINSDFFPYFRQSGFSVLAKQQVFKCRSCSGEQQSTSKKWRTWNCKDIPAIRSLYLSLVPPLIQHIEPLTRGKTLGLVYYDESHTLQAYADLVVGHQGIWVLPVIHPQIQENIANLLHQMLLEMPLHNGRPIYIISRSYQPWVENSLQNLSADPGPEQALMVHYLVMRQRVEAKYHFETIENGNPEPTIPLAPIKNRPD